MVELEALTRRTDCGGAGDGHGDVGDVISVGSGISVGELGMGTAMSVGLGMAAMAPFHLSQDGYENVSSFVCVVLVVCLSI